MRSKAGTKSSDPHTKNYNLPSPRFQALLTFKNFALLVIRLGSGDRNEKKDLQEHPEKR